jgi:DNA-binding MarR family transcriptional regulator
LASTEVLARRVDPLFLVWLVARSTEDLMDTVLRPAGVTGDEFALYSVLAASPGITPSELSRWMAAPATSVSWGGGRLEARGHLVREAHPSDRRSYRLRLTPAGRRTHRAAVDLFGPVRARVLDELAGQDIPVEDSLLFLREVVDGLRATVAGPESPAAAAAPAIAVDQDVRQPPGE